MEATKLQINSGKQFSELDQPRKKYGIGMFAFEHPGYPDKVSKNNDSCAQADKDVKIYNKENAPKELLDLIGTVATINDKADVYHYANLNDITIIHIPAGVTVKTPITIHSLLEDGAHVQHVLVVADESSSAILMESQQSKENTKFHSHYVEAIVKENAHLSYTTIQDLDPKTYHHARKEGIVHSKGALGWHESHLGTDKGHIRTNTTLVGPEAFARLNNLYFAHNKQRLDLFSTVHHKASHTKSLMLTRGALSGSSHIMHHGKIIIDQNMRDCNGHQKKEILLLSDESKIDAIPVLEIANDEVSCSHGASISHIDEEQTFYLMSRGLTKTQATHAIIDGFFGPVLDALDDHSRETISKLINNRVRKTT